MGASGPPEKPTKVLYLEANEDGTIGGSYSRLNRLVTRLPRSHFEPVVLFYRDNRFVPEMRDAGVEVHVWRSVREREREIRRSGGRLRKWLDFLLAIWRRRAFLKQHDIDFMHINNSPWTGNDDWLPACRLAGIPVVANASGGADEWHPSRIKRLLFRSFDGVVAVSRYMADGMADLGIPEERIRVAYPAVDPPEFESRIRREPEEVRSELDVGPDQMLALMVGNVRYWKGQHVVVDAFSRLEPEERERIVLAFAGDTIEGDPYPARIRNEIEEEGLEDHVRLLGFRDDVPDLMNAADLAIHASVRPEPFGNVVIEAMAVGTPIVASDMGGPLESVGDDGGWLFDTDEPGELTDVLRKALEEPSVREEMGRRGRERVERFSVDRYIRDVQDAYRDLLGVEIDETPESSGERALRH